MILYKQAAVKIVSVNRDDGLATIRFEDGHTTVVPIIKLSNKFGMQVKARDLERHLKDFGK